MKRRRRIAAAFAAQVAPGRSGRQTKNGGLRMRIWMDAQRGRWRVAAVLTGLAVALFLGACELEAVSDGKGGPLSEDELASLVAEVGPDWEVIEEYRTSRREWMQRAMDSLGSGGDDGEEADTAGEADGESTDTVRGTDGETDTDGETGTARGSDGEAGTDGETGADPGTDGEAAEVARQDDGETDTAGGTDGETGTGGETRTARGTDGEAAEVAREDDGEADTALHELVSQRPDFSRAAAAAIAILEDDGPHEKRSEAARFLVTEVSMEPGSDELAYRGAKALFDGSAEVQGWPMLLVQMDMVRRGFSEDGKSTRPAIDRFFEELASDADDPLHRAAGRYYVASGLVGALDMVSLSTEERAAIRERALAASEGLSAGVEDESVMLSQGIGTFAKAEDRLLGAIRHATVGATPPDIEGARLDGTPELLSAYRGKVVLLDFWATWCKPCIASLPDLRQLVADLPADRFALLAISVDGKLETATDFMENESMPFAHWYVGRRSDVARILNVSAFPTYILLDEQGKIVARGNALPGTFLTLIEETVEAASEA